MSGSADGDMRLLWQDSGNQHPASLWVVNADVSRGAFNEYGPFPPWFPFSIGVDNQGKMRLLWNSDSNAISLWVVNPDLSRGPFQEYGPFDSWAVMF
jgi:hypothetical protein